MESELGDNSTPGSGSPAAPGEKNHTHAIARSAGDAPFEDNTEEELDNMKYAASLGDDQSLILEDTPAPAISMLNPTEEQLNIFQASLDAMDSETRALVMSLMERGRIQPTLDSTFGMTDASEDQQIQSDETEQEDVTEDEEDEDGNTDTAAAVSDFVLVDRRDANEESSECPSCLDQVVAEDIVYLTCGHVWCRMCLNTNINIALARRAAFPPRCCEATPNGINMAAVQHHIDDANLMRLIDVGEEFADRNPTYCHNPICGKFIPTEEAAAHARKSASETAETQFVVCKACLASTCTECKGSKEAHPTPNDHPDPLSKKDRELAQKEGWKQCPSSRCRKLIARAEGCDHMTCECGVQFCYSCGRVLDPSQGVNGMACNCRGQNPWVDQQEEEEGEDRGDESEADDEDGEEEEDEQEGDDMDEADD